MNNAPQEFSPFEPNYYQHYRRRDDGWIRWVLENQATGEIVAQGAEATIEEARVRMEAEMDKDQKRIMQSFGV